LQQGNEIAVGYWEERFFSFRGIFPFMGSGSFFNMRPLEAICFAIKRLFRKERLLKK
jgi:hypothetical protein